MGFLEQQLAPFREFGLSDRSWEFVEKVAPETRALLEQLIEGFTGLSAQPEGELPDNVAQQAINTLSALERALPTDEGLDPASERPREVVTSFRAELEQAWRFWRNNVRSAIRADETRLTSMVASAEADLGRIEAALGVAEKIAEQLRDLAAEAGTLELSKHYGDRAAAHRSTAKVALGFVIALSVALVVGGFFLIAFLPHTTEWIVLARDVLARGFAIGALTYLITFAARAYRTNTHLASVYEQKVSALKTFGVFQSAIEGEEAKALLLSELVHSVFASADTGVFGKDGDTTTIIDAAAPVVAALTRGK